MKTNETNKIWDALNKIMIGFIEDTKNLKKTFKIIDSRFERIAKRLEKLEK